MKIASNVYLILQNILMDYHIDIQIDDNGDLLYSFWNVTEAENSTDLSSLIQKYKVSVEILENLENLELTFYGEDKECDEEKLSYHIRLALSLGCFDRFSEILSENAPTETYIRQLDDLRIKTINNILTSYHEGFVDDDGVMELIKNEIYGWF